MDPKKTGQIDRHKSDFDVMEHVISGLYPPTPRTPEPRGHAHDRGDSRSPTGQKSSHTRPKLRHK
jgi:hypothetical protein